MTKRFDNYFQVINWINKFEKQLRQNGEIEEAQLLYSALRIGGTSSELLGAIRNQIIILKNQKLDRKYKVQKEFRIIIKMINSSLGKLPKRIKNELKNQ